VNEKQKEMTVGYLVDCLNTMATEQAGTLVDKDEMTREARWTKIQGLLAARDKVEWAVLQVSKWLFEARL
jgi:hypothetical protein